MSAQPLRAAPEINGVDPNHGQGSGVIPAEDRGRSPLDSSQQLPIEQATVGDGLNDDPGPSSRPLRSSNVMTPVEPSGVETESMPRQEHPSMVTTTLGLDRHPSGELLAGARAGSAGATEFLTPRSVAPFSTAQNNWLGGLEMPRWVSRLGSYLSVGHPELAPSPLLGSPATPSPPPGGQPFRLRSPGRPQRSLLQPPTPPSSSDIPQEAIQAEVQRQLGGLLTRLQIAEEQNQALKVELTETQRTLQAVRQDAVTVQYRDEVHAGQGEGQRDDQQWVQDTIQQQVQVPPSIAVPLAPNLPPDPTVPRGHSVLRAPTVPLRDPGQDGDRGSRAPGEGSHGGGTTGAAGFGSTTTRFTFGQEASQQRMAPEQTPIAPAPPPMAEPRGFLRSFLGPARTRSDSPPPPRLPAPGTHESPMMDALMKGVQQLQELQAAALAKGQNLAAEVVKPGTTVLSPLPVTTHGAESALLFQDWLEVTSAIMRDVSEQSGVWWEAVLQEVEKAYKVWLAATPLERLNVIPGGLELSEGRWMRLNARVASMFLSAMTVEQRGDMVAHRISTNVVKMLYRLHTVYQPGGSQERQDVLRRLQGPIDYVTEDSLEGVLAILRNWPRWMSRCTTVGMSPPDASVLARGLKMLTAKWVDGSPDVAFRTSMLRTSLRLDGQPTMDSVYSYQRHLQAEIETMISSQPRSSTQGAKDPPQVRAIDSSTPQTASPKGRDKDRGRSTGSSEMCKYFMKPSGCKRGMKCNFSHDMSSLEKSVRNKKCLACGSESHRQRDCTAGKAQPKMTSSTTSSDPKGTPVNKDREKPVGVASVSTTATAGASDTISSMGSTVQGVPWTLETLIQAAQQVVHPSPGEASREGSPEKTKPEMRVLHLRDLRVCSMSRSTTALVDSGATHSLRAAVSPTEWEEAEEVAVHLAGSHQLVMRITASGTLLMPCKYSSDDLQKSSSVSPQTIVPMGQLINTLGYTMVWSPDGCVLTSPDGHALRLHVEAGCPQLCEMEALSLIARLEDRKLEQLSNAVITTEDKIEVAAMAMERSWHAYLYDYVANGAFESGLRAIRDAPMFDDLPGECLTNLIPAAGLWSGWDIMKNIGFLTRAQRRRFLTSKRWVVHLFAGTEGHWEIMKLDQGDTVVLELDKDRCAGQDLMRNEVWRMLLWGAKEGKIDVIMGGPPGRYQQYAKGGQRDPKYLTLIARMMWLYAVAQVGREINGGSREKNRDVGFVLEYPEGTPQSVRDERLQAINEAEDLLRRPGERGAVATWEETRFFWEHVQRPRWELQAGHSTLDGRASFWDTRLWKVFEKEFQLRTVSFDQGAMGAQTRNPTTLGTNVHSLMSLEELRVPEDQTMPENGKQDHIWSMGLVQALVVGLNFWSRDAICAPRLMAMSPTQWRAHVNGNHAEYRRDCAVCVASRGVGRQHRKVHHPESYVLTADVAGPLNPGLDATSKGTMGRNLRYLLVAKYLVPKAYIEDFSGKTPPEDSGIQMVVSEPTSGEPGGEQAQPPVEEIQTIEEFFRENSAGGHGNEDLAVVGALGVEEGAKGTQLPTEEELDYEPSEPEEEGDDDVGTEEQVTNVLMQEGDCDPPSMSFLTFATGLPNNRSSTVIQALQEIMMYLQMHGMPVYRFHSDKGEFFSHKFRLWLCEMGIFGTWSEPSVPQSNGHAESTVRWIKDRTRTLLKSAELPVRLWPAAAAMAAAEQRSKVLGGKSKLIAPFGATVFLRKKAFDKYGPLRRENGLESKWLKGRYVGLSTIVHRGHLVYIPASDGEKERFLHTLHVRSDLIEPEPPDVKLVVDEIPKPRRRLVEKSKMEDIELRVLDASGDEVQQWATEEAKNVLDNWDFPQAKTLINRLAKAKFFNERKFGVYRHGGSVGWMKGIQEYPDLVRLLTKYVLEVEPAAAFTSILVSYNTQKALHKDFNNDPRTYNYVIPTWIPERGGELWIELKPGDYVSGTIEQRSKGDRLIYGQCVPLEEDKAIKVGPMSTHEVCQWEGDRIVVIGYSPQCLGKLSYDDVVMLHEYGFPIPLSQLPEYYGNEDAEAIQLRALDIVTEEELDEGIEEMDWSMYLDLNPGMARIGNLVEASDELPRVQKTEVVYTPNIEDVLAKLSGPLDVTYTVSPSEVMKCLDRWKPAIEKELKSIEVAIERLSPGSEERKRWLNREGVQRLPTKFVFTVKPNDRADESEPSTWFKRKARLVVCGNMATEDGAAVYTETAPAEAVRAGLTIATRFNWTIAVLDVVAAFLKTPMNRSLGDPIVVVQPPRLLETMGLAIPMELWGLVRALYGLRQSPALWGEFRDFTLRSSSPPEGMSLQQGGAATSWWKVVDHDGNMIAIILVYVDDFLLCGPADVVTRLATWIRGIWETSDPTILTTSTPIRFLGMELQVDERFPHEVAIGQQGYIQELLRLHSIPTTAMSKIPISKELVSEREVQKEIDPKDVHFAQQLTGEILWLAQRSRPDISYTSSIMASLCLKQPLQVIEIGLKTLGYLQRTAGYQLRIRWEEDLLVMFCDAAYAPQSARSHGGWLVSYGGSPIMWRSGRQAMVTLSTAEAELLAIIDGAIALKGVEALLMDMGISVGEKQIESDSTAALSISTGSSSWRTRHLKIKTNWIQEQVSYGQFTTKHCPGERQLADLLTKALSSARISSLLQLWRVGEPSNIAPALQSRSSVSSKALVAVICCLLMVTVRAAEDSPSPPPHPGVQLDWDLAGVMMLMLMVLGGLMVWEAVRWLLIEAYNEWTPGARGRRLKRLRKLQAATAEAIERELQRLQPAEEVHQSQRSTAMSSSMSPEATRTIASTSADVLRARRSMATEDYEGHVRRERQRVRTPSPTTRPSIPMASPGVCHRANKKTMVRSCE